VTQSRNGSLTLQIKQNGLRVYFDIHVDDTSILYNYLPTNKYFAFTNIPIKRTTLIEMELFTDAAGDEYGFHN
jgi:hypothetical protein